LAIIVIIKLVSYKYSSSVS